MAAHFRSKWIVLPISVAVMIIMSLLLTRKDTVYINSLQPEASRVTLASLNEVPSLDLNLLEMVSEVPLPLVNGFQWNGTDVMVFLHIQKTSGTQFGLHLLELDLPTPCGCNALNTTGYDQAPSRAVQSLNKGQSLVNRCHCPSPGGESQDQWLFSRYTFGWVCGIHPDLEMLRSCLPRLLPSRRHFESNDSRFKYVTVLRDPIRRTISEYRHVKRGAVWDKSRSIYSCKETFVYAQNCSFSDHANLSIHDYLSCDVNPAWNRQTFMLANWGLIPCANNMNLSEKSSILLKSAISNLRQLSYFGLTEYQQESQLLFESTFDVKFTAPFNQPSYDSSVGETYDEQDLLKLQQRNVLDMQLYKFAEKLFWARYDKLVKRF